MITIEPVLLSNLFEVEKRRRGDDCNPRFGTLSTTERGDCPLDTGLAFVDVTRKVLLIRTLFRGDIYALRDRLTELKKDFEINISPIGTHGFTPKDFVSNIVNFFRRRLKGVNTDVKVQ